MTPTSTVQVARDTRPSRVTLRRPGEATGEATAQRTQYAGYYNDHFKPVFGGIDPDWLRRHTRWLIYAIPPRAGRMSVRGSRGRDRDERRQRPV